jgi:hypothetical protein
MKIALLTGALVGIFYQNSATAKDQDGIVMFGEELLDAQNILRFRRKITRCTSNAVLVITLSLTSIGKLLQNAVALLKVIGS